MMGFPMGFPPKPKDTCPNCGAKGWDEKRKDMQCDHCGFKRVEMKAEEPAYLIYCKPCGCHYTNGCTNHSPYVQTNVLRKKT